MAEGQPRARTDLISMISVAYDAIEAARSIEFQPTPGDYRRVSAIAGEVLAFAKPTVGACVPLTALWTCEIRERLRLPAFQVAGTLVVDGEPYFDGRGTSSRDFEHHNPDWPGHSWLALGPFIGDASMFWTAAHMIPASPLRRAIERSFGKRGGFAILPLHEWSTCGFEFDAAYVLTDQQVEACANGARERWRRR